MRSQNQTATLVDGMLDSGKCCVNSRVVLNLSLFDGYVEVNANKYAFAFQVEVFNGKLCHEK
jgi:beta-lactamase class D